MRPRPCATKASVKADGDARGDAYRRELEAERQSPPQPPEVPPDGGEVEVETHVSRPATYKGGNPVTRSGRFSPKNSS